MTNTSFPPARDATLTPQQRAQALLLAIPPEVEPEAFEAFYVGQVHAAMQRAQADAAATRVSGIDPLAVEEAVWATLICRADGTDDTDGIGWVPGAKREYGLHPPTTDPRQAPPKHTAATPAGMSAGRRRKLLSLGLAVVLLLGYAFSIWGMPTTGALTMQAGQRGVPTPSEITTQTPLPTPEALGNVGDTTITTWYPVSVEVPTSDHAGTQILQVQASSAQLGSTWTPAVDAHTASWLRNTYVNTVICVHASLRPTLDALQRGQPIVLRPANGTPRRFTVLRVQRVGQQQVEVMAQHRAGLTLVTCGEPGTERTVVETVYQPDPVGEPVHTAGTRAALADLVSVQLATVTPVTTTTALPPGSVDVQLDVLLTNLTTAPLALDTFVDQLERDGRLAQTLPERAPTLEPQHQQTVQYHYRVADTHGPATWRLMAPTGEQVTFTVVLPSKIGPDGSTTFTIQPTDVRVGTADGARQLELTLTFHTTATTPITITQEEVTCLVGTQLVPLIDATVPVTVTRDTPAHATIHLAYPASRTLIVQYGAQRVRLTLPQGATP